MVMGFLTINITHLAWLVLRFDRHFYTFRIPDSMRKYYYNLLTIDRQHARASAANLPKYMVLLFAILFKYTIYETYGSMI